LSTPNQNSISTPTSTLQHQLVLGKKGGLYRMNGWEMDVLLMREGLIP